jgi:hypothetical protein
MAAFATRTPAKVAPPRRRELEAAKSTPGEIQVPHEEIAKRAFEKFAGRGFVHGFQDQDWYDAEDELRSEYRERL